MEPARPRPGIFKFSGGHEFPVAMAGQFCLIMCPIAPKDFARAAMIKRTLAALLAAGLLAGCSSAQPANIPVLGGKEQAERDRTGSLFDAKGSSLDLLGSGKSNNGAQDQGIAVNSYLWRATLDTLSFMPIASADPFGGVILTDWYSPPGTPDARFKVNVYILDRQLRADGVRASVFRQEKDASGQWHDVTVAPDTSTKLEDTILTRARQMRVAQQAQG